MNDQERNLNTDTLPEVIPEHVLQKHFHLSDADLVEVELCRGGLNRLGFAVQLCTLRWYGFFLSDLERVPKEVLLHLTMQLGFLPFDLQGYPGDEKTRRIHTARIQKYLGFVRCGEQERERLLTFLQEEAKALPKTELLRKAAHRWLHAHQVVRPGRTTVRELVGMARDAAYETTFQTLNSALSATHRITLDVLVKRLRNGPMLPHGPVLHWSNYALRPRKNPLTPC